MLLMNVLSHVARPKGICGIRVCLGANHFLPREICDLQCPGCLAVTIQEGSCVGLHKVCLFVFNKVPKYVELLLSSIHISSKIYYSFAGSVSALSSSSAPFPHPSSEVLSM